MEKLKQGPISQDDLIKGLIRGKKLMDKVDSGNFDRGFISENMIIDDTISDNTINDDTDLNIKPEQNINIEKIKNSKLPDNIKKAMIENPIPSISLNDVGDSNFVKTAKRLMEQDGIDLKSTQTKKIYKNDPVIRDNNLVNTLTPIIENIIRKTLDDIVDKKLNQILTAYKTASLNENLVLKVGDSIFKGKITGVNKVN